MENRSYNNVRGAVRGYQVKMDIFGLTHLWEDGQVPYRTLIFIFFLNPPKHTHTHTAQIWLHYILAVKWLHSVQLYLCDGSLMMLMYKTFDHVWWMTFKCFNMMCNIYDVWYLNMYDAWCLNMMNLATYKSSFLSLILRNGKKSPLYTSYLTVVLTTTWTSM